MENPWKSIKLSDYENHMKSRHCHAATNTELHDEEPAKHLSCTQRNDTGRRGRQRTRAYLH